MVTLWFSLDVFRSLLSLLVGLIFTAMLAWIALVVVLAGVLSSSSAYDSFCLMISASRSHSFTVLCLWSCVITPSVVPWLLKALPLVDLGLPVLVLVCSFCA